MKTQKRMTWLVLTLVLIITSGLIGYNLGRSGEPQTKVSFYALIEEVGENQVMVMGIPENDINHRGAFVLKINDDTQILASDLSKIALDDLSQGQEIGIVYDGIVLESYPAMITQVYEIHVLD